MEPDIHVEDVNVNLTEIPPAKEPSDLAQILNHLEFLVNYIKQKKIEAGIGFEWKAMSLVIDRMFFWITFIIALVIIPVFLAQRDTTH